MYVQSISTPKVKAITAELCGHEFSSATVSRINESLGGELAKFAERRLEEEYPYLVLMQAPTGVAFPTTSGCWRAAAPTSCRPAT
jgi:hypothetical protein